MARDTINESIRIAYVGTAVDAGTADLKLFADSLEGLYELLTYSNKAIYDNKVDTKVSISANFEKGSFEFLIEFQSILTDTTLDLFQNKSVQFVSATFFTGFFGYMGTKAAQKTLTLFDLLRFSKGEKVESLNESIEGQVIKISKGDETIEVPAQVWKMYNDLPSRKGLEDFLKPLATAGVDKIETRDPEKKPLESVNKNEFLYFRAPNNADVEQSPFEGDFMVVEAQLTGRKNWRLQDTNTGLEFEAKLYDEDFLTKVKSGSLSFKNGDTLYVRGVRKLVRTGRGLEKRYEINSADPISNLL